MCVCVCVCVFLSQMGPFVDFDHPAIKSGLPVVPDSDGKLFALTFEQVFELKGTHTRLRIRPCPAL